MATLMHDETLVTGQLLQIRDKVFAKRHLIPKSMNQEWLQLLDKTSELTPEFVSQTNARAQYEGVKKTAFTGSINDLMTMLKALTRFNDKLKSAEKKALAH